MKLNLICSKDELRPALNHVQITDVCVGCNSFTVGVIPRKETILKDINFEEGALIHHEDWKIITTAILAEQITDNTIKLYFNKKRPVIIQVENENEVGKYPNWQAVMPDNKPEAIESIGIDAKLLLQLQEALGLEKCKLTFNSNEKAISISGGSESQVYGIIMPTLVS